LQLDDGVTDGYEWLEFDYRNYRLVTAKTNRGGGKHIYFPLAAHTTRLATNQLPWQTAEYALLLDPTNQHDAQQLKVLPNGFICPRTPKTKLNKQDCTDLSTNPTIWHKNGFNYLRASISIEIYNLNYYRFVSRREECYSKTLTNIKQLILAYNANIKEFIDDYTERIFDAILPSAEFSLAARCAIEDYILLQNPTDDITLALKAILEIANNLVAEKIVNWDNA
jgi:hypothetical protein